MRMKTEFIADCLHLLQIQRPLDLRFVEVINDWDACYQELTRRHEITVSPRATRCRLSLIAHELVHASVTETHPKVGGHGWTFRRRANRLQRDLAAIGWHLKDKIYIRGVDK